MTFPVYAGELDGCGYCGPYCPKCTSTRGNKDGWVEIERHSPAVLYMSLPAVGGRHGAQRLVRGVGVYLWGDYADVRDLRLERANRHDARREAQGAYCPVNIVADGDEWSVYSPDGFQNTAVIVANRLRVRGRRVRSPGQEWALMCSRVWGSIRSAAALEIIRGDYLHRSAHARRTRFGESGRKNGVLRAVALGGWLPHWNASDYVAVRALRAYALNYPPEPAPRTLDP